MATKLDKILGNRTYVLTEMYDEASRRAENEIPKRYLSASNPLTAFRLSSLIEDKLVKQLMGKKIIYSQN